MKHNTIRFAPVLLMCSLLAGCTLFRVGPDYQESDFAVSKEARQALNSADASNELAIATWWNVFNDPQLTNLVAVALATNRNLAVAEANIRAARAQFGIAGAAFLPGLGANGDYQRIGTSANGSLYGTKYTYNQYQGGFDANWEIDIFGGNWRRLEASYASMQAAYANRDAVRVEVAANVAMAYISYRASQQRLVVAENNVTIQSNTWELVASRAKSGIGNELPVQQATYNLERTRAAIPLIKTDMEAYANSLAVLTGEFPGSLHASLAPTKDIPSAPHWMLKSIPANTLQMRPDVRAAERAVAAAVAQVGVATAEWFPKFAVNGSLGLESINSAQFFTHDAMYYSFGPTFSWAIFRGGSILNNIRAKNAAEQAALLSFEQTVLTATKEIRDALVAYQEEYNRYDALTKSVDAARAAIRISEDLYKNGLTDFNNVLDAQRSLSSLEEELVISRGSIGRNLVALYKALGGGWEGIRK